MALFRNISELVEFTEDHPESEEGWFLLGYLRTTSGDAKLRGQALAAFRKALEKSPDDPHTLYFVRRLEDEARAPEVAPTYGE